MSLPAASIVAELKVAELALTSRLRDLPDEETPPPTGPLALSTGPLALPTGSLVPLIAALLDPLLVPLQHQFSLLPDSIRTYPLRLYDHVDVPSDTHMTTIILRFRRAYNGFHRAETSDLPSSASQVGDHAFHAAARELASIAADMMALAVSTDEPDAPLRPTPFPAKADYSTPPPRGITPRYSPILWGPLQENAADVLRAAHRLVKVAARLWFTHRAAATDPDNQESAEPADQELLDTAQYVLSFFISVVDRPCHNVKVLTSMAVEGVRASRTG